MGSRGSQQLVTACRKLFWGVSISVDTKGPYALPKVCFKKWSPKELVQRVGPETNVSPGYPKVVDPSAPPVFGVPREFNDPVIQWILRL